MGTHINDNLIILVYAHLSLSLLGNKMSPLTEQMLIDLLRSRLLYGFINSAHARASNIRSIVSGAVELEQACVYGNTSRAVIYVT